MVKTKTKYNKLTEKEWAQVRALYVSGRRTGWIRERYGIAKSTLGSRIKAGKWVRLDPKSVPQGTDGIDCVPMDTEDVAVNTPALPLPESADLADLTPEARADRIALQVAQQANELVIAEHKKQQVKMWALLHDMQERSTLGAGKAGMSRALLDLANIHEKLLKMDRLLAGLDRADQAQVVKAIILIPAKMDTEDWLTKNMKVEAEVVG